MLRIRYIVTIYLLFASGVSLSAAQKRGYEITLHICGNQNGKPVLAMQTADSITVIDSLPLLKKGTYRFKGKQTLPAGQYMFIRNGKRLFHFLISDEKAVKLQFYAKTEDGRTTDVSVRKDAENNAYLELQRFLQDANRNPDLSPKDIEHIDRYTDSMARQYPNTLLAIIARNISTPPLPEYMALGDRRVLHTSILPVRLKSFFTYIVPPLPDSVIRRADHILELCTDSLVKAWCGEFLLSYFLASDIMGMENAAVYLAKKYISGELKTSNKELISSLETYVSFNEHSLIGMRAPELCLPDAEGKNISLLNLDANYIILVFYDEDCPICQEELPEINRIYEQYKSKGCVVYAVYTQDRRDDWLKYASELNLEWIQVWDPDFSSGFHKLYNVTGTPKIFLLDRNKTIIGRGLDAYVLEQILSYQTDQP